MNWKNVRLVWSREVRDQLRDRRTLFTIAILPLVLYPLLGMSFLQITQFMQEHPSRVWVIGSQALPRTPALLDVDHFATEFSPEGEASLFELDVAPAAVGNRPYSQLADAAEQRIRGGEFDAVVLFPSNFGESLTAFRDRMGRGEESDDAGLSAAIRIPEPAVFYNRANDGSRIAYDRIERVLTRWRESIVAEILRSRQIPVAITAPFEVTSQDVSEEVGRRAALWSKVLPFIVLIWALTGAFYPAIDLCAGEKERGTLETLLCCPAERSEIVGGKLLTVISFSAATALLNLASMGVTGVLIINQLKAVGGAASALDIGPPPWAALGWLLLAVLPISSLFSALALAIAAFARSSKEGQYYLMPLLLITLPLMMLPMLPTAELNLGFSLIPVSGMMLWLRALIEGQHAEALRFALPVLGVTAGCCWLAIRWAVRQFEDESVLFRETESFGLGLWLRHVVRDRRDTPSVGEALLCGIVLLMLTFFASLHVAPPEDWAGFIRTALATQIGLVAFPALVMTVILTRRPADTLLLRWPRKRALLGAFLLAVALHPSVVLLGQVIQNVYPVSEQTMVALEPIMEAMRQAPLWQVLLLIALTPAICEELAFRGFILSGLRHIGSTPAAIVISSLLFGLTHGLLQQSLAAAAIGMVIGYIAIHTGSILPGLIFHFTHNSLSILVERIPPEFVERMPRLDWLVQQGEQPGMSWVYSGPMVALSLVASLVLLAWFRRIPYRKYAEEALQEALDQQFPKAEKR